MSGAVLSRHVVSVPPRQTCHLRAMHPSKADSIVLTECAWDAAHPETPAPPPRNALHLAVDPEHKLVPGKTSFTVKSTEMVYVEIGNCSDTPLEVGFEIWGDS